MPVDRPKIPSMIYLASPYSHIGAGTEGEKAATRLRNYNIAKAAVVAMLKKRILVYSPIVHCHEIAYQYQLPSDADYWMNYNSRTMLSMGAVYVLQSPGWESSKGVAHEISFATHHRLLLDYVKVTPTEKRDEYLFDISVPSFLQF